MNLTKAILVFICVSGLAACETENTSVGPTEPAPMSDAGPSEADGQTSATDSGTTPAPDAAQQATLDDCTQPADLQYVAEACTLDQTDGTDTVLADCTQPAEGQFVDTPCATGDIETVGADTGSCSGTDATTAA